MNTVLALAPRFQRAGGRDARVTTALAITAFAVSTGLTLSVVGGLLGFAARADLPLAPGEQDVRSLYETLAWVAVILLVVPLVTLGGAAARLGVARRDARLATLRLLGATPREVVGLTVAETAWQGLVGAVLGILLYVVLLPLCALLPFQGTTFSVAELWVGWQGLAIALVAVPLLAALSGAFSLRRVAVSPLGVARRETPKKMTWLRVVVAARRASARSCSSAPSPVRSAPLPWRRSSGRWPSASRPSTWSVRGCSGSSARCSCAARRHRLGCSPLAGSSTTPRPRGGWSAGWGSRGSWPGRSRSCRR